MSDAGYTLTPIARIRSEFKEKFGIPRQSGLVEALRARVVFEPAFRRPEALRGLEAYSHLWLIWQFSQVVAEGQDGANWRPTVRPPRLGGNRRMGVFATRSPYRPNALGLSCVRLLGVEPAGPEGPVLTVGGADLLDGTPIFDVKPYVPLADCRPQAVGGFAQEAPEQKLEVDIPPHLLSLVPEEKRAALTGVLAQDPRPSYQKDSQRVYGFGFGGLEVHFTVDKGVARIVDIHG